MRLVTIASLGASAVLGLGALFVAKVALPGASQAKATAAPREVAGAPMVVATRPIKYGERLDAGMLTLVKVPANAVPQGAFTTVAAALAADRGTAPVALTPISQREPLLPTKLSGPGERTSVAAELVPGMRAYAVKVDDATGVGGHALPGDHVDVVLMRDATPQGPQRNYVSHVVIQNARVLGMDLNADPTTDKPASPNTATLEVTIEESQKLSVAVTLGTLSLALRKSGAAEIEDTPPMRTADFLVGGSRTAAPLRTTLRRAPAPSWSAILIIEGEPSKRGARGGTRKAAAAPPAVQGATGAANTQAGAAGIGAIG